MHCGEKVGGFFEMASGISSSSSSSTNNVRFRLLFANTDVKMEYEANPSTKIIDVKKWIIIEWEKLNTTPAPSSTDGIRLICMGASLDNNLTLGDSKIPKFAHPTPVNVAMLPQGQTYSQGPVKPEPGTSSKATQAPPNSSACCVIS